MPDVAEHPPQPTDRRGHRIYVYWAVGLTLLALLGAFCWAVVVPVWRVRRVVFACAAAIDKERADETFFLREKEHLQRAVQHLGGPGKAVKGLWLYLKMPECVAPRKKEALDVLGHCGEDSIPALVWVIGNCRYDLRTSAMWKVAGFQARARSAVPALRAALRDSDPRVRRDAAEALAFIPCEAALHQLVELLDDENAEVRTKASFALWQLGAAARIAIPKWLRLMTDKDESCRSYAATALGKIGLDANKVVPVLMNALADDSDCVQSSAAEALGRFPAEAGRIVPALEKALDDDSHTVRCSALEALGHLGEKAAGAVPSIRKRLQDTEWVVRDRAVETLGMIGPKAKDTAPEIAEIVFRKRQDRHERDRGRRLDAARALVRIDARSYATQGLTSSNYDARWAVTRAMGVAGAEAEDAVPLLASLLERKGEYARYAAARSLAELGPHAKAALQTIRKATQSPDPFVRYDSMAAEARITGSYAKTVRLLREGLGHEHVDHRAACADALGVMGAPAGAALPQLKDLLRDEDEAVRYAAASALEKIQAAQEKTQ